MDIILLGAPGAGKGTQADALVQWLQLPHVSSGELFRSAIAAQTPLGVQAKAYIDRGELVPDQVTVGMVGERLAEPDCARGAILDGFPRTVTQAAALDDILTNLHRRVNVVLYISVSTETLLKRLAGRWICRRCGATYHELYNRERVKGICDVCGGELYQREDDTPETQRHRIDVYLAQTAPLIDHYRAKGLLIEIDGEQDVAGVQCELRKAIESVS